MKKIALSDNELISLYVNGDESALKILIQRHEKRVFSYILLSHWRYDDHQDSSRS